MPYPAQNTARHSETRAGNLTSTCARAGVRQAPGCRLSKSRTGELSDPRAEPGLAKRTKGGARGRERHTPDISPSLLRGSSLQFAVRRLVSLCARAEPCALRSIRTQHLVLPCALVLACLAQVMARSSFFAFAALLFVLGASGALATGACQMGGVQMRLHSSHPGSLPRSAVAADLAHLCQPPAPGSLTPVLLPLRAHVRGAVQAPTATPAARRTAAASASTTPRSFTRTIAWCVRCRWDGRLGATLTLPQQQPRRVPCDAVSPALFTVRLASRAPHAGRAQAPHAGVQGRDVHHVPGQRRQELGAPLRRVGLQQPQARAALRASQAPLCATAPSQWPPRAHHRSDAVRAYTCAMRRCYGCVMNAPNYDSAKLCKKCSSETCVKCVLAKNPGLNVFSYGVNWKE